MWRGLCAASFLSLKIVAMVKKGGEDLMGVEGLADEWEAATEVRQRVMGGGGLLHEQSGAGEDIKTCVLNSDLLAPMLQRMASSPKLGHPPIDTLQLQVERLFERCKRVPAPDWETMRQYSWRLRFLLCFIKMKARRKEVSVDAWMGYFTNMVSFTCHA